MLGYACPFTITELPTRTGLYELLYCTVFHEQIRHGSQNIPGSLMHTCTDKLDTDLDRTFCYKSMHSYM